MKTRDHGLTLAITVLALGFAACGGGGGSTATYTLSVVKGGAGTGTVSGGGGAISCGAVCSASLASGTAVTLTATADAGSTFEGWSGCDTASGASCGVTMGPDRTVTATFTPASPVLHALSVQKLGAGTGSVSGGGGAIACGATCSTSLASGTAVTLTATADAGSTFAGWSGCDTASGPTCDVTMSADHAVTATFDLAAPVQYTLGVQKLGAGSGTVTGGGGALACGATCAASLASGTMVTLTATADAGSTFTGWAGCDTSSGPTCDLTMGADRTVTATFDPAAGSLQVVNGTALTVAELYASPAAAGTWGLNLLTSQIAPSGTTTVAGVPAGAHDFRAVAADGISYWQTSAVVITAGGLATWTLVQPAAGSLSVTNAHCIAVDQLYVRPTSSPNWSPNQLTAPLPGGSTPTLMTLPVGTFDLTATALDGQTWTTSGIVITAGGTSAWSLFMPAATGCLSVVNNTLDTFDFLFDPLSPAGCGTDTWDTDRLGGQPLLPGATFTLSLVPQGTHDLRVLGVTPLGGISDIRFCGAGILTGGTITWYLGGPP